MTKLLLKIFLALAAILALVFLLREFAAIDDVTELRLFSRWIPVSTNWLIGAIALTFAVMSLGLYVLRRGVGGVVAIFDFFRTRRTLRGFDALSNALIALAESDGPRALTQARRAKELLDNRKLTLLVNAQAARLAGNEKLAEGYFEEMSEDRKTSFLGIRGLLGQALKQEKPERALRLAERAHALRPKDAEILDTMFELQRAKGDWAGARRTIEASVRAKRLTRDVGDRRRAVLHFAEAQAREEASDATGALREALGAVRLAPGFAPAAAMSARLLTAEGEPRNAVRTLVEAWRVEPHPDLAAAFAGVEPDEAPENRLRRFQRLFDARPDHEETRLLKAELAIAADDLETARDALGTLPETAPSARACALMAAIEQGQAASDTIVRGWLSKAAAAPRGPQWVCDNCGAISGNWRVTCARCGSFDSLGWRRAGGADGVGDAALFPLLAGGPPSRVNGPAPDAAAPQIAPPDARSA